MSRPSRHEIDEMLRTTFEDRRLSRSEGRALKEVFLDFDLDKEGRDFIRHRAFAMAREAAKGAEAAAIFDWLEDLTKLLEPRQTRDKSVSDVRFSPGDECLIKIRSLLQAAHEQVDVCVFTITDDRLVEAIVDAHRRRVDLRIVTDNDKAYDRGSDAHRLAKAGIPVRVDESEHHMHHKYALFDRETLLTGSYNWTRSAARHNRENLLVTDEPSLVGPYQQNFDELWESLKGHAL